MYTLSHVKVSLQFIYGKHLLFEKKVEGGHGEEEASDREVVGFCDVHVLLFHVNGGMHS